MKIPDWPVIYPDQIKAVVAVLESGKINYLTGDEGISFEREFADYIQCENSIALANGTVALDLALRVLNIGPGDEVVVTPRSFIASVSSVFLTGARPVFADVDVDSGNLTVESIERVVTSRTKAIIAVHLSGWPCEMNPILEFSASRGIKVIEDCAQAHGAMYRGRHVGTIGEIGAWSFCQDKIITTGGEGGMLTTKDTSFWRKAWSFKDHGKNYDAVYNKDHPPGFRWLHESFGTNWRLTEMQSAIGRIALKKLQEWIKIRQKNAEVYIQSLSAVSALRVVVPPNHLKHSYYRYYVYVRKEALKNDWSRDRIINELITRGLPGHVGTCSEIYLEKAFIENGLRPAKRLSNAKRLGEESLMFPVHPNINFEHISEICDVLKKICMKAVR